MLSAAEILDIAIIDKDFAECIRQLELSAARTHHTSSPGVDLTESEKLVDEALWYARAGDWDEAIYRLEQADDNEDDDGEFEDEDYE